MTGCFDLVGCVLSGVLQFLFCVSSSRCHGLVYGLLLRNFLVILTYFLVFCLKTSERWGTMKKVQWYLTTVLTRGEVI